MCSEVDTDATTIVVFLLVLAGLQTLSLGLTFYQICRFMEAFDERQYEDAASSLLAGSRAPSRGFGGAEGVSLGHQYKSGKHAASMKSMGLSDLIIRWENVAEGAWGKAGREAGHAQWRRVSSSKRANFFILSLIELEIA